MSQRFPVEAHGHLYPVSPNILPQLRSVFADWALADESIQMDHEGDLLRFSVQGVCFPLDDVEKTLTPLLTSQSTGRIDLIDRENWTLTRLVTEHGTFLRTTRNLNDVLHFSGF